MDWVHFEIRFSMEYIPVSFSSYSYYHEDSTSLDYSPGRMDEVWISQDIPPWFSFHKYAQDRHFQDQLRDKQHVNDSQT